MGEFLRFGGRLREAIPWHKRTIEQARELGSKDEEAIMLRDLAFIHLELNELQLARKLAEEALVIQEHLGDPEGIAHALAVFPDIAMVERNLDEALAMCDRWDSLVPDDDGEVRRELEVVRAEVYRRRGDERHAAARLRAAAEKTLHAEESCFGIADILIVAADLVTPRAPTAAAQLVASAKRLCRETSFGLSFVLESERITAGVATEEVDELGFDDALRLVLDCLGSGDSRA
ncbi:MAG TPA: tetratricopeptide repeat protein [Gaiellaceae bacterium]|nr:tetratricopeptide repeat protein [Gaiellaceae bacterium]